MGSLIAPPGSAGSAGADAAQALFQEARRRRRRRWLAGIAAVVVTGAVVALSAVAWQPGGRGQSHPSPAALRPAALRPAARRQVPPYFAQLTDRVQVQAQAAVMRSTLTGHVLATVTPPRPYQIFTWVSAAGDDRTFVLAAQRYWPIGSGQAGLPAQNRDNTTPTVFFRMTFDPATKAQPGDAGSFDIHYDYPYVSTTLDLSVDEGAHVVAAGRLGSLDVALKAPSADAAR